MCEEMVADDVGIPQDSGIRPCDAGEWENGVKIRQKTFTGNRVELVQFEDEAGNQGQEIVNVHWIDRTPPQAVLVQYAPMTATNGEVVVSLLLSETGNVISSGWEKIPSTPLPRSSDGAQYERGLRQATFTDNTGTVVDFVDIAGNT
jgi:hypothetical protein